MERVERIGSMTQHEWFLAGMVGLGVALGILLTWLTTGRARNFRKTLLKDLETAGQQEKDVEQRFFEITGNRTKWKRSLCMIRKPFSKHVNLAIETAAMIYALVAVVNCMVHFQKWFHSPMEGYGTLIFLTMIVGFIPTEHLISTRAEKEMDNVLDEMEESMRLKRAAAFLERARREWK
jgi:hypothetical protein